MLGFGALRFGVLGYVVYGLGSQRVGFRVLGLRFNSLQGLGGLAFRMLNCVA